MWSVKVYVTEHKEKYFKAVCPITWFLIDEKFSPS